MPRVEIYSSPWCPFCWIARLLLRRKGVTYEKIPIRFYLGVKLPTRSFKGMVERTGGDTAIPQIFVDGHYLGDDDDLSALQREGRLDPVLRGEVLPPPPRWGGCR